MNLFALVLPVVYTLLQILSIMLVGFCVARFGKWDRTFFQRLSAFMVRIALPIYFIANVSQSSPDDIRNSLLFPFVCVAIVALNLTNSFLVFRLFPQFTHLRRIGIAMSTFGNAGMIPLTLIELFPLTLPVLADTFGTTAPLLYVGTYLLVASPLLWSIGNFLIVGTGRLPKFRELLTPPVFGIAGGLAIVVLGLQPVVFNPQLPFYYLMKALERFGDMTYPTILFCLGALIGKISINKDEIRHLLSFALVVSAIRFLLLPAIFIGLYWTFLRHTALTPAQIWVIFLEMHIPPASNLSMMAAQSGINEDQVSFTTLVTYIIYLIVLPVYVLLLLAMMGIG